MTIRSDRDLDVWLRAVELAVDIHRLTQTFPRSEMFSLTLQVQRASQSIAYNIAEGHGRLHRGDFTHHLSIARGSLFETETQLEIALRLGYLSPRDFEVLWNHCQDVGRLLNGLIRSLQPGRTTPAPGP